MAFTSPELVRTHLSDFRLTESVVDDAFVVLNGTAPVQLPHAGLSDGSIVVKSIRSSAPQKEEKILQDDWVTLTYPRLVPGTVLFALDSSLGTIYYENLDAIADYRGGRIKRISGGGITSGQAITIWYDHYHVYTEGDDYTADETSGQLTRRASGAIADGQTVTVDYTISLGTIADAVIENAITEAGDAVLALIDTQYHEQPSPGIIVGETHWAVAAICRTRAAVVLSAAATPSSQTRSSAQTWLDLADQYERSGHDRLIRFAAPVDSLRIARRH